MDDTLHYLIMANQMLVQKALLEQLKDTGLTIGQPKILDYLKDHDGSNQKEIAKACFLEAGSLTTILNKMEEERADRAPDFKRQQTQLPYLYDRRGKEETAAGVPGFCQNRRKGIVRCFCRRIPAVFGCIWKNLCEFTGGKK